MRMRHRQGAAAVISLGLMALLAPTLRLEARTEPPPEPPPRPAQGADAWIVAPNAGVPVAIRLDVKPEQQLIPGLYAEHVRVVVRNRSDDRAVAIRGVKWWEGGRPSLNWHGPIVGSASTSGEGEEFVVRVNETVQALTSIAVEQGLLLPGEQISVAMPFTPQRWSDNTLQVDYVSVGGDDQRWQDAVLVPGPAPAPPRSEYRQPPSEDLKRRDGRGGTGLIRSTMTLGAKQVPVEWGHFRVPLPVVKDADPKRTGGITFERAAADAGAGNEDEGYLGYYRPSLEAWFFIRGDGLTRTLRKNGEKWVFDFAVNMPAIAPELFGRGQEKTSIVLNPEIFGHIVQVQTPSRDRFDRVGKTSLDADELWKVLALARQTKGVELRAANIDPSGLGQELVLTLGVELDAAGNWVKPKLDPEDALSDP